VRVCVFCGSRPGVRPEYARQAFALGGALAEAGAALVYGGSGSGLMGAVADGALQAQGHVIGVFPRSFLAGEFAHPKLSDGRVVETMAERKSLMVELSDAFVALPGGFGTYDELFEVLTGRQIGSHHKPIGLLDTEDYFAPLLELVRHGAREGLVPPSMERVLVVERDPATLVRHLLSNATA
jgi:uncharacterized protein (TIGR00730 family)